MESQLLNYKKLRGVPLLLFLVPG